MIKIRINGIVQGVGFRPFVYRIARELQLKGYVLNASSGVEIAVEGTQKDLEIFQKKLEREQPPAAYIDSIAAEQLPDIGFTDFVIKKSDRNSGFTRISPDLATCEDCVRELFDPEDHRYEYPFINCTNCGPRYSIIESTPYDRPATSMQKFKMCSYCKKEYTDPINRRFHAQPVACFTCGPQVFLLDKDFKKLKSDPISETANLLKAGKIIGIKGIGGFHLACDASNFSAVAELRKRKDRPDKPFAIMTKMSNSPKVVEINKRDLTLLHSPASPVVILPKKHDHKIIARNVAPQNPHLGVFLPYAPLHHLLLEKSPNFLVMTSGNPNGEPIATDPEELSGLCDYFLTNDRPILNRSDDSVIRPAESSQIVLRRSRGYVPNPITLNKELPQILGTGAELKLTFALSKADRIYPSPYIGNRESRATEDFYREVLQKYRRWFKIEPEKIGCDLHPNYRTTDFARKSTLPFVQVQHHHAHIAAVMAENNLEKDVIGIVFDGTGYGSDGKIWGGEIMQANYQDFERCYHLNYMPLPGGDAAIRHPIRIAYAYLKKLAKRTDSLENITEQEKMVIDRLLESGSYIHETSSMGRLFDCVAAILGLYPRITFEAQSATALEFLCGNNNVHDFPVYNYELSKDKIHIQPLITNIADDFINNKEKTEIACKFHNTIIEMATEAVRKISLRTKIKDIVLAGGVMQNKVIWHYLQKRLIKNNFTVYTPKSLSPNDSSIAVGQIMVANAN